MNGERWARWTLGIALAVSIGYNVANICLTQTTVHVLLRIPQGIVWPVFLFLGIEVMIRNKDLASKLSKLARLFLMGVTVPTAVTSYINLHDFMEKAGEPGIAQLSGPLAIDGLMLGCTLYLLASRSLPAPIEEPTRAPAPVLAQVLQYAEPIGPMPAIVPVPVIAAQIEAQTEQVLADLPIVEPARTERAPRAVDWDMRKVAEMAVDGMIAREIAAATGVSPAMAGRFTKVAKILKADPRAEISAAEKVRPEGIRMMRELISR